jgi:hypothetical protein
MTVDMSATPGPAEDDIIDAEVVSRASQLKARGQAALADQRVRVAARLKEWFGAADVTDEKLAAEIARRRRIEVLEEQRSLKAQMGALQRQAKAAAAAGDAEAAAELHQALAAAQAAVADADADAMKVAGGDLMKARWAKRAQRLGGTAAGGYGVLQAAMIQPTLGLAALGALPAAWWYLGRPWSAEEKARRAAATAAVPGYPGATGAEEAGAVPAGAVPPTFVPDSLAAMSRVSLVKPESGRVQGEHDLVTALVKAGIITAAQRDETHLVGPIKPVGPGWSAVIDLPRGDKATAATAKVEELASALRLKKSQIEMRVDTSEEGHEGRLVLWVANESNPYGSEVVASELVAAGRWDLWVDGVPLGIDARSTRHSLVLVWSSLLIGGLPGFGKSFLARLVAAAAALDPTVTVHVATGKPGPDWAPLKQISRSYVAGNTPEKVLAFLDLLNDLIADMREIGERLETLAEENPERCREGKLTPELAQGWGRGLTLLIVDELQELLDAAAMMKIKIDDDPESRDRGRNGKDVLVETMARFVRVSRYAGGMGLFITQRPDSDSVPTKLREVCQKRACFRVKGANSSKMVLGEDAVAAGAAPHMLLDSQKGVVVLDQGDEEGHVTLKSDFMTVPELREICLRGRQLRIEAGTLDGFAAEYGKADAQAAAHKQLLDDCVAVLDAEGVDRARTERLLELLAAHRPETYADLSRTDLQARLRDAGAGGTRKLGPIDGMANPNGYLREQFTNPTR